MDLGDILARFPCGTFPLRPKRREQVEELLVHLSDHELAFGERDLLALFSIGL
jgi:hypothetical protein